MVLRRSRHPGDHMPFPKHSRPRLLQWAAVIGWLLFSLAIAFSMGVWQENQLKTLLQQQLNDQTRLRTEFLRQQIERGRQSLVFLAHTPPIAGLARAATSGGFDRKENNSAEQWKERLSIIFLNYAVSMPGILQLNLIGVADQGRELVRLNNHLGKPELVPESALKPRGNRPLFKSAMTMKEGDVGVSDIELYRENGVILRPLTPWIRFWTPCFTMDKRRFALLLVAIDASTLLKPLVVGGKDASMLLFVANQDGIFLSHPDAQKTFGADLARHWRWSDEFASSSVAAGYPKLHVLTGRDGKTLYASSGKLVLSAPGNRPHWLTVTLAQPTSVIEHQVFLFELRGFLFLLLLGSVAGLLLTIYQRQRRAMHAHQAELAAIVNSAQEAIIGHLEDGTVTSWNPMATRLFGYTAAEAIGGNLAGLIVPVDRLDEANQWYRAAASGQDLPIRETCRHHRNGDTLDVAVSVTLMHTDEQGVPRLADTIRDITQQKANEAHLKEVNALLEKQMQHELLTTRDQLGIAIEVAELGVWSWILADNTLIWNERMFEMYGYPVSLRNEGLTYAHWRARVHPDDIDAAEAKLTASLAGSEVYDPIFRLNLPDGRVRFIQAGGQVERDDEGKPLRVTGINRDITTQREYEDTLDAARKQAEAASRAKADFLSNMSHEIRTPMNAILGLAFLLDKSELSSHARELVLKIRAAGRSLLGIINDILDFSKIEAGSLTLEQAPFSLGDLLDNLSTIMATNVGDKDLELVITPPPPAIDRLVGDALRLEQVLINLTSNAIKFTEQGFVEVSIRPLRIAEDVVCLKFSISDSGIGIAHDKQAELFRPFTQADASTTRRFGGTGLGLAISRKLVEMMGGKISLMSEPGNGSSFSFSLTLPREASARYAHPEMAGLNVFIADDNRIALDALSVAATGLAWRVKTASSGAEALDALKQHKDLDVVILDWKMPDHSGLTVARAYYESLRGEAPPIILMATAYSREALLEEQDIALIDGVIIKPVTSSCLYNAVARALKQRQGGTVAEHIPSGNRLSGLHILVVDDSDINRDVAQRIFSYEGAEVYLAENGQEALDWLRGHADSVDLVLMDIQMPVMDGYEAARRIRQQPEWKDLPIVALTAGAFKTQRDAAREAGMNDYIAKPFDIDEAVARIQHVCGLAAVAPDSPAVAATEPASARVGRVPGLPASSALQAARGLEIWREAEVYKRYLRKFARDYLFIAQQIAQSDTTTAKSLTHKLKGVAGNLALSGVEKAARVLDEKLAADVDSAQAKLDLTQEMAHAISAIKAYAGEEDSSSESRPAIPKGELAELFNALLEALDSDDIEQIETAMLPLIEHLDAVTLSGIKAAVEDFDFRGAEQAVLGLVHRLFPEEERES
jgi:PAS domain S-box-containing protein